MSAESKQNDLRHRQQVAEQAKRLAESLATKTDAKKPGEFPSEFSASGAGKVEAAIEP